MPKYLTIDIGNSRSKIALYNNRYLESFETYDCLKAEQLTQLSRQFRPDAAIVSSVGRSESPLVEALRSACPHVVIWDDSTPIPIRNAYATPGTLGKDRLAAAIGAYRFAGSGRDCLVIDAGTALTFERITADGQYLGGAIAPGMRMRFESLHYFTQRLPRIAPEGAYSYWGDSTESSIRTGVVDGLIHEIDGRCARFMSEAPDGFICLTGGDASLLSAQLHHRHEQLPDLVPLGLLYILEYNAKS